MPVATYVNGYTGATPPSNAYHLTVNGVGILVKVPLDEAPIEWEDQASNGVGQMTFVVEDTAAWASRVPLPRGANVVLRDLTQSTPLFGGTLLSVRYSRGVTGRFATCTVSDYDWWLDHRIVPRFDSDPDLPRRNRRITSDRAMVKALIEARAPMIGARTADIEQTNTNMPVVKIEGVTVREALEAIADAAQSGASPATRHFYVDYGRHLHWYSGTEGNAAPYVISPAGIQVEDLEVEYDSMEVVHEAYVKGKNASGSGWVYDTGSDYSAGAAQAFLDRPKSDTVADRNRGGRAFLRRNKEVVSGRFYVQQTTGWRAGQLLTITDAQLGLTAQTFEIKSVQGTLDVGNAHSHRIEFGSPRRSLVRHIRNRDHPA